MENTWFIYGLVDPLSDQVRYVGASKNPQKRLLEHLAPSQLKKPIEKNRWLKELLSQGHRPRVIIIEKASELEWEEKEKFWIEHFESIGIKLTNQLPGGIGGPTALGKTYSPEHRAKIAEALRGNECYSDPNRKLWNKGTKGLVKAWNKGTQQPSISGERNPYSKLTMGQVREIRATPKAPGYVKALAEKYEVSKSCIERVLAGKTYLEIAS
jgi:hypothetical protein